MTTKTKPEITSIPVADIQPIEGLNPRGKITDDNTADLTASIDQLGVLMPVLVAPRDNGHWPLIAGARRLHSARKLKLKEIPALVRTDLAGSELEAAIVENAQREDLDPVEEAMAIQRLIDEKGLKQVDAAKAMGKSERWLRERLRLLKLPSHTQRIFAARQIPIEAAVQIEKIAKAAPAVADLVAVKARHGEIEPGTLTTPLGLGEALTRLVEDNEGDTELLLRVGQYYAPADLPVSAEQAETIVKAYSEVPDFPRHEGMRPAPAAVQLTDADRDAAKAAGALIEAEVEHWTRGAEKVEFVAGGDWLVNHLLSEHLPKLKRTAQRKLREREKSKERLKEARAKMHTDREKVEAEKKAQRAERIEVLAELGRNLDRVELDDAGALAALKLVCGMALGHEHKVERWVEMGLGEIDARVMDEDPDQQVSSLADRYLDPIANAGSAQEALGVVVRILLAVHFVPGPDEAQYHPARWAFENSSPRAHLQLEPETLLDELGVSLGVLPGPLIEEVKARNAEREKTAKEAAERASRVEAAKAEKAAEDEGK